MRVLVVHAHPEPTSFTAELCRVAESTLQQLGHEVEISDLYAEGFDPVAGRHDFTTTADPDRFHYQSEQHHASRHDGFAPDLVREQQRTADADMIVFTFPLWWGGVPAILKGWFDRVLAYGFAYEDGMRFESGYFHGRTAVLGVVTGGTPKRFSAEGTYGEIEKVLWPVQHCTLRYMGLTSPEPFVAYAAPRADAAGRAEYLRAWREHLELTASQQTTVTHTERPHASSRRPRPSATTNWSSSA